MVKPDLRYEEEYYLGWFLVKERLREILGEVKSFLYRIKGYICKNADREK